MCLNTLGTRVTFTLMFIFSQTKTIFVFLKCHVNGLVSQIMLLRLGVVHNVNTFIRLQLALPTLKYKSDADCALTIACSVPEY